MVQRPEDARDVRLRIKVRSDCWIDVRSQARASAPRGMVESPSQSGGQRLPAAHLHAPPYVTEAPVPAPVLAVGRPHGCKPVVVLIEAVPSGAEELAATIAEAAEGVGFRPGLLCLDRENRLGIRLGCVQKSPSWCWQQETLELFVQRGGRTVIPAPANESDVTQQQVHQVLQQLHTNTDVVVVDLGCRWDPRLFRPVLNQATHIWVLTRSGQWSGAEMRLEQAEFSGWTDMRRVQLVVVGGSPPSGGLQTSVAGVLPEAGGQFAQSWVARELWRG